MQCLAFQSQRGRRENRRFVVGCVSAAAFFLAGVHLAAAQETQANQSPADSQADPRPALEVGVRIVIQAVSEAAEQSRAGGEILDGDALTDHLVRRAAGAARGLPHQTASRALLLGLGVAIDDSEVLRTVPLVGPAVRAAESEEQRRRRLAVLGKPTMRGRRDLAQHFFVSAALASHLGPRAAEALGVAKELRDSQEGTGFSFADLAADLAGITFAARVREARISLDTLAESFAAADFLPESENLPEGIPWNRFQADYGSVQDERFLRRYDELRRQVLSLPGFQ